MTASKLGPPAREGAPIGAALQGVGRAFSVLELVADRPLRASEIARALGLSWATAHRVLTYLTEMGYLDRDPPTRRYSVGVRSYSLGSSYLARLPLHHISHPYLEAAATVARATAQLVKRDHRRSVVLGVVEARRHHVPETTIGCNFPAALRFQGPRSTRARDARVRRRLPEPAARALTSWTVVDPEILRRRFEEVRARGYAVTDRDVRMFSSSVAAPVSTPTAMSSPRSPSWSGRPSSQPPATAGRRRPAHRGGSVETARAPRRRGRGSRSWAEGRVLSTRVQLQGSTVLLTGATGGIGQAIARALDARGARVVLNARRASSSSRSRPRSAGGRRRCAADLSEPRRPPTWPSAPGPVDMLVANAALPASGPIDDFSPEQIDRALDVNLRAPIQLTRALLPGMVERGSGHLVFVSSLAGKAASVGLLALLGDQVRPARLRLGTARGPARQRRRRDGGLPGLRRRRRHVRRDRCPLPRWRRHAHARAVARRRRPRHRAGPGRDRRGSAAPAGGRARLGRSRRSRPPGCSAGSARRASAGDRGGPANQALRLLFRQITHDDLGCASYLIGDENAGVAAVVDAAARHRRVPAPGPLHGRSHRPHPRDAQPRRPRLRPRPPGRRHRRDDPHPPRGGARVRPRAVRRRLGARARQRAPCAPCTRPGHRPEHTAFALIDTARGDEPWAVLTGDTLFVGDIARPDLAVDKDEGARGIFRSLHERLLTLPDTCEVWPGHLGGSLCGGPGMDLKVVVDDRLRARALRSCSAIDDEDEFVAPRDRRAAARSRRTSRTSSRSTAGRSSSRRRRRIRSPRARSTRRATTARCSSTCAPSSSSTRPTSPAR